LAKLGYGFRGLAYACKQPHSRQGQVVCFMPRDKGTTTEWSGVIGGRWELAVSPQH